MIELPSAMDCGSETNTDVLNLRITVQKLQEELSLYRNGTEAADFIALIEEKDTEVKELKEKVIMRDEKMRKLVKIAGQLEKENKELTQHQKLFDKQLHKSYEKGRAEAVKGITQTDREVEALKTQIASLQADNEALTNSIDMLIPETEQFQDQVDELQEEQINSMTDIEKLQKRCVNVVIEMKQNKQELIDRVNSAEKELKKSQSLNDKYHAEVLKAQGFNGDLKDKLASYKERIAHLEKSNNNSSKIASKENPPVKKKASGTPGRTAKRAAAEPFKSTEPSSAFASGEIM